MLTCYICLLPKEEADYYKSGILKRDYICKPCSAKVGRAWRAKNKKDPKTRYKYLRSSAKSNGKGFSLTLEQYTELVSKPCYYCERKNEDFGGGLDRINNDKSIGYSIDNVLPCCGTCNKIRGNSLTVEETKVAITAVLKLRKAIKTNSL